MTARGLAKLIEECGELQQVAGKRLAYYHTDVHPDGEGSLDARMENEMGDVMAAIKFVSKKFDLNVASIELRAQQKLMRFQRWDEATDNNADAIDWYSGLETGRIPFAGVVAGVNYEAIANATNPPEPDNREDTAPAIKIGDRVRINIGTHSALPLEGWTVYRLPTQDWPSYGVKHDNGGDMTINREYVGPG